MGKYIIKEAVIEATQWLKNGDHPQDGTEIFEAGEFKGKLLEGKLVRYYRHPGCNGQKVCSHCGIIMHLHGWIDNGGDGQIVCPGEFIITVGERFYLMSPTFFKFLYKKKF